MRKIQDQPEQERCIAKQTLAWLVHAKRPLKTVEMQHAAAVEVGKADFDAERIPSHDLILSACFGFVVINDEEGQTFQFASTAAQNYVEQELPSVFPEAAEMVALICISYISLEDFTQWTFDISEDMVRHPTFEKKLDNYPFMYYAVMYWWDHASKNFTDAVRQLTLSWSKNDTKVSVAFFARYLASRPYPMAINDAMATAYKLPCLTAAHYAAEHGATALTALLIQEGMPADTDDYWEGRTPLSSAAEKGHISIVELLLGRNDVQVNSKDHQKWTPLFYAAEKGHTAVVEALLQKKDVLADSKDNRNRTPLSHAAANGHVSIVKLLLARNDVAADSEDRWGQTPIYYAAESGHEEVVSLLMSRPDVDVLKAFGKSGIFYEVTLLHLAASNGMASLVQRLLDRGIPVDSKDHYGQTPLMLAAHRGRPSAVELLLDHGASVEFRDSRGKNALLYACLAWQRQIEVVRVLVERGADIHWDINEHIEPHTAFSAEDEEVLRLLLDRPRENLSKDKISAAIVQVKSMKARNESEGGCRASASVAACNRVIALLEALA